MIVPNTKLKFNHLWFDFGSQTTCNHNGTGNKPHDHVATETAIVRRTINQTSCQHFSIAETQLVNVHRLTQQQLPRIVFAQI